MSDTSPEYITKVIAAAPFADNEAGIPQMVALIKALARDLAAERDRAEKAEADAKRGWSHADAYVGKHAWAVRDKEAAETERERLAKELAEARAGWLPIETAPKDGTKFDAWVPSAFGGHRMCNLSFNHKGQLRQHGLLTAADLPRWPTYWMPLPETPALTKGDTP
jgi:hypothetical protein